MRGSRIFFRGGGSGPTARKQSGCFFSPPTKFYSLQRGSNGFITETTTFLRIRRGPPFSGRGGWGGGIPNC